jgi:HlyD family secretion protein
MKKYGKILLYLVILAACGLSGGWYLYGRMDSKPHYRTVAAEKGELLATISATGTIEPEEVVDVGAQVAGLIQEFGKDPKDHTRTIDYGSNVEDGTVLAQIDQSLYAAAAEKARADVGQAEANVRLAEANLLSMRSKLVQTKRDWDRVKDLRETKALSDFDIDTAQNAYETAQAAIPGGEAAVLAAKKLVETDKAVLHQAEINLGYCVIKSPVKGTIVDRRVNIGQTVVSSLSAPSLFLIAKDLKRLQVWASVNEADIGNITPGQMVRFTVDAFAGRQFRGQVSQIRLNATNQQQVVTYTVVVSTDNSDGKLLPYMTANLQFEVSRHKDVLLVPNAALRWQPQTPRQVAPDTRAEYMKAQRRATGFGAGEAPKSAEKEHRDRARVWVSDGEFVRPISVRIGLTDGTNTEVVKGDLQDGMAVVIGESRANEGGDTGVNNPFAPQLFRPKGK